MFDDVSRDLVRISLDFTTFTIDHVSVKNHFSGKVLNGKQRVQNALYSYRVFYSKKFVQYGHSVYASLSEHELNEQIEREQGDKIRKMKTQGPISFYCNLFIYLFCFARENQ